MNLNPIYIYMHAGPLPEEHRYIPDCTRNPYPYTAQLTQLETGRPRTAINLPSLVTEITTPLNPSSWEAALQDHPDLRRVSGERNQVRIPHWLQIQPQGNMRLASQNTEVVNAYIRKEVELGRIVHIKDPSSLPRLHQRHFGVIPKKHRLGKWRLIVNLSAPADHSINHGIAKELCSLSDVSIDEVTAAALPLGRGTRMAKMDIKEAYRAVPVHPEDRLLLGMRWQGTSYADKTLPFGLRSAPLMFTALADGLEWAIRQCGVEAKLAFHLTATHIPGIHNDRADVLS